MLVEADARIAALPPILHRIQQVDCQAEHGGDSRPQTLPRHLRPENAGLDRAVGTPRVDLDRCRQRLASYPTVQPRQCQFKGNINPYHFIEELFAHLSGNDIFDEKISIFQRQLRWNIEFQTRHFMVCCEHAALFILPSGFSACTNSRSLLSLWTTSAWKIHPGATACDTPG
jgi:hypothetical protein